MVIAGSLRAWQPAENQMFYDDDFEKMQKEFNLQ